MTCGVKHVKWWSVKGGVLVSKAANLSSFEGGDGDAQMQTMLSVAFGPVSCFFHLIGSLFLNPKSLLIPSLL